MIKRNLLKWMALGLVLSLLVAGSVAAGAPKNIGAPVYGQPATDGPATAPRINPHRLIVQLEDAPLALYEGGIKGLEATALSATGAQRLDVNGPAARAYLNHLAARQAAFKAELAKALPGARVEQVLDSRGLAHELAYRITFNGVAVWVEKVTPGVMRALRSVPGVKAVFPDVRHELDMYASLPLIGAATMWDQAGIGGQLNAGRGIKIASIDTGVYAPNPCFSPDNGTPDDPGDDFDYPPGFPKGEADFTNGKVIAARAYFRPWDPPLADEDTPWPGARGSSHGTHTGGTMACNANTTATVVDHAETISGVAPGAWLMNYRVFYPSSSTFSGSAFTAEIVMAIEDAVADGADVINYSAGGTPGVLPMADPVTVAFEGAWDAGVFVAKSAGNDGPGAGSLSDGSDRIMLVGASTTSGTIAAGFLSVTSPAPVPEDLQDMPFGSCLFCPRPLGELIEGQYVDVGTVTQGGTQTLCNSEPIVGELTGKIALISRGGCFFSDKVWNAQQAGAIGAIVYNNQGDALLNMSAASHQYDTFTIPGAFIGQTNGENMLQFAADNPGATAAFDYRARQIGNVPDVLAGFSSRGPLVGHWLAPHVTAPGVNILSGGYAVGASGVARHAGFGQVSGTSMAAPHVAGSGALLRQLYPSWTPDQVKSALMTTADTTMWLDQAQTQPAGVLDAGAGRIDLSHAWNPGLTFDHPSVSFGDVTAPWAGTLTIRATEVAGISATYDLSTEADEGIIASTDLRGISVAPGGTASFQLTVEVPEGTAPGDYTGYVWLEHGPHKAHIPFWVRVNAPMTGAAEVLLIDNDFSDLLDFPDYTAFYTSALEALGVTYDYYNADLHLGNDPTLPPAPVLNQYQAVIFWTGDNWNPDGTFTASTPLTEQDQWILTDYLDGGGRVLATGQDLAAATDVNSGSDPTWDRSNMYHAYLGARYLQDSLFDPEGAGLLPPAPSVTGAPGGPFEGMTIDISGSAPITNQADEIIGWEDGAGNQFYVDQIAAGGSLDDPAWDAITPLMVAIGGSPVPDHDTIPVPPGPEGVLAVARGDEPTLERPDPRLKYRAIYLGFGFEAINDDTGFATREQVMGALLAWLLDEVSVEMAGPGRILAGEPATFVAEAVSSQGAEVVEYLWDFGDGTPSVTTTESSATHTYAADGAYQVRVMAKDSIGHSGVAEAGLTVLAEAVIPAVADLCGYVDSRDRLGVYFGSGYLWTGQDTRPKVPRWLHGVFQVDLASVLPEGAVIVEARAELTGRSTSYLSDLPAEFTLHLLPSSLDADWTSTNYYWVHNATPGVTLAMEDPDLAVGGVNTFAFSEEGLAALQVRLEGTGRASFRADGVILAPYGRHVMGWDGRVSAPPVLVVTYYVP